MKPWTKLSLLCLGLAILGSPAMHVCRIVAPAGSYDLVAPANAAEKAPSLTWEDLRSFDFQTGKIPPELKKHDGGIVRVPGFVIPLEDSDRMVSEFLLVPFPLACIHVPAPPPNQIVHVKMDKGKKITFDFYEPVWAQGRLKIQQTQNMYTDSSYFMTGLSVEPYREKK
jgi:hypothetical protein